jgi:hypothetical protein
MPGGHLIVIPLVTWRMFSLELVVIPGKGPHSFNYSITIFSEENSVNRRLIVWSDMLEDYPRSEKDMPAGKIES